MSSWAQVEGDYLDGLIAFGRSAFEDQMDLSLAGSSCSSHAEIGIGAGAVIDQAFDRPRAPAVEAGPDGDFLAALAGGRADLSGHLARVGVEIATQLVVRFLLKGKIVHVGPNHFFSPGCGAISAAIWIRASSIFSEA